MTTRFLTHFAVAALTVAAIAAVKAAIPAASWFYVVMLATGYVAFGMVAFTLSVGTLYLFWRRRNPVNLNIRRDTGWWAGGAGAGAYRWLSGIGGGGKLCMCGWCGG